MELGKLEHFCRGTMQTGQYKSTLFFKYLKKLHECTDSGAVELGDFLQIGDKFFESPLDNKYRWGDWGQVSYIYPTDRQYRW